MTDNFPPIIFAHSELELEVAGPRGAPGLSAGYLSARDLSDHDRAEWMRVFAEQWSEACDLLGGKLKGLNVDAFAVVPCSRPEVEDGIRRALAARGLVEIPGLIAKAGGGVSYAGKPADYLRENTKVDREAIRGAKRIAICDDFSESGRTLYGLYAVLTGEFPDGNPGWVLASVGVSASVAYRSAHDLARGA